MRHATATAENGEPVAVATTTAARRQGICVPHQIDRGIASKLRLFR